MNACDCENARSNAVGSDHGTRRREQHHNGSAQDLRKRAYVQEVTAVDAVVNLATAQFLLALNEAMRPFRDTVVFEGLFSYLHQASHSDTRGWVIVLREHPCFRPGLTHIVAATDALRKLMHACDKKETILESKAGEHSVRALLVTELPVSIGD